MKLNPAIKIINYVALSAMLLLSNTSFAGCDSCMQSAANTANSQISNALNQVISTVNQSIAQTQALTTSIQAADQAINLTLTQTNLEFRTSLGAAAARISAEIARNTKAMTELTNHQVTELSKALAQMQNAKQKLENDREFSNELAQPSSGAFMVDRSIALKQGRVQQQQMLDAYMQNIHDYNDSVEAIDKGMTYRHVVNLANMDKENYSPTPMITDTQIGTADEQEYIKNYIKLVTNHSPLKNVTVRDAQKTGAARYELDRRIWNSRMEIVQYTLADEMLDKTGTIDPTEWRSGYMEEARLDDNGKVSLMEALRAEVDGRLMTPGWYQNMKEMSSAGLSRETVYQKATQLKLMWEMLKKQDHTLRLLALQTAMELEEDKDRVRGLKP